MPTHIRTPIPIAPTSLKVYILDFRPDFWKRSWLKLSMMLLCRQKTAIPGVSKRGGPPMIACVVGFCGFDSIEWPRGYPATAISVSVDSCSEGRRAIGVLQLGCTRERVVSAHVARCVSVSVLRAQSRHSLPRSTSLADATSVKAKDQHGLSIDHFCTRQQTNHDEGLWIMADVMIASLNSPDVTADMAPESLTWARD